MFWGLIMEPKRRYTQTVKMAFHVSMAALDITSGDDEPAQVLLSYDNRNYLICTLQKGKDVQVPLDLNFEEGDEVSFATNGNSHVHLTGYLITDESTENEEENENSDVGKKVSPKKSEEKKKKRKGEEANAIAPTKKSKTEQLLDQINENDETDSDDMNFSDILKGEDDESGEEEGVEEEESDEEAEDEELEIEGEESDEIEEEEVEEEESSLSEDDDVSSQKKAKQNGLTPKKKEKGKEKEQKQNQTPKGKENQDKKTLKKEGKTPLKEGKTPQKTEKDGKTPSKEAKSPQDKQNLQKKTLEGGVQIQDIVVGNGPIAKPGKMVQVYYEGRLKSNNKVFDSTKQGNGFKFRLGHHEVIKGWDVGVQGMKVGGKRRIICPPSMAYGQKGSPPVIPANATLIFEVELKNVH